MSLTDIEESKNGGAQAHRAVAVGEVTPLDDEARNDAADRGRQGHMRSERVARQVTLSMGLSKTSVMTGGVGGPVAGGALEVERFTGAAGALLAGAKRTEVLGCLWHSISEEPARRMSNT